MFSVPARIISFVLVLFLLVAVLGVADGGGDDPATRGGGTQHGVIFGSDHLRLTAHFRHGVVQIIFSDGREMVLPQVVAASGTRYSDGFTTFWNKGDTAVVELDGIEYTVHVIDPATDPWEQARRAGVNFRAVGQEPGWLLEIRDHRHINLLLDYGDTRITTPIATMEVDFPHRTTTYRVFPPTSPLRLTILTAKQPCYDAMSGEGFSATAVIEINDGERVYKGCGRWLN